MNTADRSGQTLFAAALAARINEAASTILAREPGAAEQVRFHTHLKFVGQLSNGNFVAVVVFIILLIIINTINGIRIMNILTIDVAAIFVIIVNVAIIITIFFTIAKR